MATASLTLSDSQFDRLRRVIYDRAGIHFPDSKKYVLESRLSRRVEELDFNSFDQYLMFLTSGPYQQDEFQEMFNRITINETSFFRNEPQLAVFENRVLPKVLEARKTKKTLRVWSAACSTGEEPYTLAIQVHRSLGVRLADWRVEILGTDISAKALAAAHEAKYSGYAVRNVSPAVLQRYFREQAGIHEVDPAVRELVHFEHLNLKDTLAARRFGVFDVIFCRNVMIYFDQEMRRSCAEMFLSQLADDGTLFIGHSESLDGVGVAFHRIPVPEAFAYVKEEAASENRRLSHVA